METSGISPRFSGIAANFSAYDPQKPVSQINPLQTTSFRQISDNQLRYKELFSDHSTNYNSSGN